MTPRPRASNKRWDFLRPWCVPLHGRLSLSFPCASRVPSKIKDGIVEVSLSDERGELAPEALLSLRMVLVLLTLLARVDRDGWKYVFTTFCCETKQQWADGDGFQRPVFRLKLRDAGKLFATSRLFASTLSIVLSGSDAPLQVEFWAAAKLIQARGSTHLRPSEVLEVRVIIHATEESCQRREQLERTWCGLQSLKTMYNDCHLPVFFLSGDVNDKTAAALSVNCAVVLHSVEIGITGDTPVLKAALLEGGMMSRSGVAVSHLCMTSVVTANYSVNAVKDAQQQGMMFEHVLCASSSPLLAYVAPLNLVSLKCQSATPWCLGRFLSAVTESGTARKLALELESRWSAEVWTWVWERLAYALFSPHARAKSSITEVTLTRCSIRQQDAEAVASVLKADDPVRHLFSCNGGDSTSSETSGNYSTPGAWMLKRGSIVRLVRMHCIEDFPLDSATWPLQTDVYGVTVVDIGAGSQPTIAILPGYGVCDVIREDLHPVVDDEASDRQRGGVTSLDLTFSWERDGADGLLRLLEAIGSSLTRLKITMASSQDIDIWRLFRACPKLQILTISGPRIDSAQLVDAYRATGSRITEIDCAFTDLGVITRALRRQTLPITRTLKRLAIKTPLVLVSQAQHQLRGIAPMLRQNETVECFEFALDSSQLRGSFARTIQKCDGKVLQIPFPLECRLAFLSIFKGSNCVPPSKRYRHEEDTPLLAAPTLVSFPIDKNVLSIIFDFAGYCALRRVHIIPV